MHLTKESEKFFNTDLFKRNILIQMSALPAEANHLKYIPQS